MRSRVLVAVAAAVAALALAFPPSAARAAVGSIRFGALVKPQAGESYATALARSDQRYGRLAVVRYFDGNSPDPWPDLLAKFGDRPAIVSFRIAPSIVLSGSQDAFLRSWFAQAPTDRPTWFSYLHEPEDDIERGAFTAAQFRAAFAHVTEIARSVGNPQLRATLILMCWTTRAGSGRDWHAYYASGSVDVIAWDCYNAKWRQNAYGLPTTIMGGAVAASREAGVPWGIAELGSVRVQGDDGTGRAAWLGTCARYVTEQGGIFLSYFDTNVKRTDYRLTDEPSRAAWYAVVSDQNPF